MGRMVRNSRGKTMKPNFFVFCEGKTEINYVKFLRSVFRVLIPTRACVMAGIYGRKSDNLRQYNYNRGTVKLRETHI